MPQPTRPSVLSLRIVVPLFGLTQIIAWGSLFYSVAVLARPMADDLGLDITTVFAAFSASLGVSGLCSPWLGRAIDRRGGSAVLSAGSLISAGALALIALAQGPLLFFLGWVLAGVAMAANLYDAAFAVLSQFSGTRYRQALTALTLFGGFASTVFWPLAWHLHEGHGWRVALGVFAVMHIAICLPIHRLVLPQGTTPPPDPTPPATPPARPDRGRRFWWLAAAFTLCSFVISAMAAHGVGALQASGLDAGTAIFVAALIGPMQVVGRALEFVLARGVAASRVGMAAFAVMLAAMGVLWQVALAPWLAFVFAIAYGLSNGVMSIVRGTVPAELFGRDGYGALMGRLAQPTYYAKAAAPLLVALLIGDGGSYQGMALLLIVLAALALGSFALAVREGDQSND
ncbi:MAG: MFS transporter [Rhodocyclales bacterium]|nr:MFS transporter [Rhodocyclales bacterium]